MIPRRRLLSVSAAAALGVPLGIVGLGTLAGCESAGIGLGPAPTPTPTPDPDLGLLARVVAAERTLVDAYAATVAEHRDLAGTLRAYADHHARHLSALLAVQRSALAVSGLPTATPTGTPSRSAKPTTPPVPEARAAALAALGTLERQAGEARSDDLERAHAGGLARLLASIGACETEHAVRLGKQA